MIELIFKKYGHYNLRYDPKSKILYVREPMLVKDFTELKNIIKEYEVEITEIVIIERGGVICM